MEFRNTDFKSPEQTASLSGKTVKFNKTQRRLVLPTFPVIPNDMGTGSPTGIHISVISRCKSVVRLYQQSAIRSKRKMADGAFLHLIVGNVTYGDASNIQERYSTSATMGPRMPMQFPQGSRNWHIQSSSSIFIGPR